MTKLSSSQLVLLDIEVKTYALIDGFTQYYGIMDSDCLTAALLRRYFSREFESDVLERARHRLEHHWALCNDVHSCDKKRFVELSEDEAHRAFRKSVVDACGEEYRVNGWRKRVRRAARDVTCAILLDDFFYL